jgi:hypothetical protein
LGLISSSTIGSGGTGYTVGNVLTLVGGTSTVVAQITVSTVSSGVITGFTVSASGTYTAAPSNPASLSGGTGSGATLNTNFTVNSTFTITNAGSGYIEQPSITFSSGGAAAYATVGSGTIIRSLGTNMDFYTPNANIGMRVYDAGGTGAGYWRFAAGYAATASMTTSSTAGNISSGGAGSLNFQTNNLAQTQFVASHTASAVNYVQVTGSATGTGNSPTISAQGSDADVNLTLNTKANGLIRLQTAGITRFTIDNTGSTTKLGLSASGGVGFQVTATGSQVNSLSTTGTVSGSNNVVLSTQGTDTDIDLSLTPKGAGAVRFGTYTGTILTPTGYVTIKDSGGTTRRLLVG